MVLFRDTEPAPSGYMESTTLNGGMAPAEVDTPSCPKTEQDTYLQASSKVMLSVAVANFART